MASSSAFLSLRVPQEAASEIHAPVVLGDDISRHGHWPSHQPRNRLCTDIVAAAYGAQRFPVNVTPPDRLALLMRGEGAYHALAWVAIIPGNRRSVTRVTRAPDTTKLPPSPRRVPTVPDQPPTTNAFVQRSLSGGFAPLKLSIRFLSSRCAATVEMGGKRS